jgi:hypothetical protein
MRINAKVVAGTIDVQIFALVGREYNTIPKITDALTLRPDTPFAGEVTGKVASDDTIRRHVKKLIKDGSVGSATGQLMLTDRGAEMLSAVRSTSDGFDSTPPKVGAIIAYLPGVGAPKMICGSLVYLGP